MIHPEVELNVIEDDPDDDKIIECAVAEDADYIVSGDSHLLDLEQHAQFQIYSTNEFLNNFNH